MFIYKGDELLYYRHFGKALRQEALNLLVADIMDDISSREGDRIEFYDYYKFRVSYITKKDLDLVFLFVSGLTDKFENIKKELEKCEKEFINLFEDILHHRFDAKTFEVFDPIIDTIHKNLRPKISLVGFSGVGKTTITKLIRAEEIPMKHVPTITGDIATVRIGKLHFHLWDFAGQEQFSYLWNNFIKGSDAVLLITDSTLENVEKSKFFLELIKEQAPYAHTAVICNKQDLKRVQDPSQIERILGLKSYSMTAVDPENRDKMIQIIADILEMSAEVSPLLKPLLERDKLIEEATNALKGADFGKAAFLFDKISDLCIELGDDSLGKEFFEKTQKIKKMLSQVGAPQPTPAHPVETDRSQQAATLKQTEVQKKLVKPQEPIPSKELKVTKPLPPRTPPSNQTPLNQKSTEKQKIKQMVSKEWVKASKKPSKEKDLVKPKIIQKSMGLKLDPEDFMVKIRPKRIDVVPKDAKVKLKTSAFGHVKNILEPKASMVKSKTTPQIEKPDIFKTQIKTPIIPKVVESPTEVNIPVAPTESLKTDKEIITQKSMPSIKPTETTQVTKLPSSEVSEMPTPVSIMDIQQKENLKKNLIELKIKKANMYKMSLDFEMKELQGEISAEELKEKKRKIAEFEKKLEEKIQELQNLLKE